MCSSGGLAVTCGIASGAARNSEHAPAEDLFLASAAELLTADRKVFAAGGAAIFPVSAVLADTALP
jgi:hypothetical protein